MNIQKTSSLKPSTILSYLERFFEKLGNEVYIRTVFKSVDQTLWILVRTKSATSLQINTMSCECGNICVVEISSQSKTRKKKTTTWISLLIHIISYFILYRLAEKCYNKSFVLVIDRFTKAVFRIFSKNGLKSIILSTIPYFNSLRFHGPFFLF